MLQSKEVLLVSSPNNGGMTYILDNQIHVVDNISTTGIYSNGRIIVRAIQRPKQAQIIFYFSNKIVKNFVHKDISDIHDVLLYNNHLYAVSTGTNEIVQLSMKTGEITKRWKYPGEGDSWHLNCLGIWNDRLVVSAFGIFQRSREYKGNALNNGFVMDVNTQKKLWERLTGPHTPRQDKDRQYICDSGKGRLLVRSNNLVKELSFNGFTRGICFTDQYIIVGLSHARDSGKNGLARIKLLAKTTLTELSEIRLPFREIYDICIISEELLNKMIFNKQ